MPVAITNCSHIYMPDSPFESAALRNITLTLEDGAFVGLIGHTGSGKSTLVQHMNALLLPTEGSVVVFDMDTKDKASHRAIRKKVGLVFQYPEYQLFEETVLSDIAFGPKNTGLNAQEAEQAAREAAQLVGLSEDLLDKSPFDLSGGQKRRVAIAGVIAMRPDMLILDEPAAGLDPMGRREMLDLLKRLHEERHITLLMVSHSMNDVAELCTRILVMEHGNITLDGTPDEVFSHAKALHDMGLGVPDTALLAALLREKGVPLPENLWRLSDLADAIAEWRKSAK